MSKLKLAFFFLLAISVLGLVVVKFRHDKNLLSPKRLNKNLELMVENKLRRVFTECCGYTLIGEKPVSIEYFGQYDFPNQGDKTVFFEELERVFKGSKKFILKIVHFNGCYSEIALINVRLIKDLAINDRYFSQFVVKHYKSIENFFTSLSNPHIHIVETLKWDTVAIGIVLGFGTENSKFFQRYMDVGLHLRRYPFICLLPFEPKPLPLMLAPIPIDANVPFNPCIPKQNPKFVSFEDELEEMERVKDSVGFKDMEIPYMIQLPFFISKKGNKSDRLHRRYLHARNKLSRIFLNKKFREIIPRMISDY